MALTSLNTCISLKTSIIQLGTVSVFGNTSMKSDADYNYFEFTNTSIINAKLTLSSPTRIQILAVAGGGG